MKIKSKKEIEENKLKKQKVLKILKRILDILMYSWALILTIGLIVGSCSKKNNGSTNLQLKNKVNPSCLVEDYDPNKIGSWYYSFNETKLQQWWSDDERPYFRVGWSSLAQITFNVDIELDFQVDGQVRHFDYLHCYVDVDPDDSSGDYFHFGNITAKTNDNSDSLLLFFQNSLQQNVFFKVSGNYQLNLIDNRYVYIIVEDQPRGFLSFFGDFVNFSEINYSFSFNEQINYNAPVNTSFNQLFIASSDTSKNITIDLPFFESAGMIFNRIRFVYVSAVGSRMKIDEQVVVNNTSGYYFNYMSYENTISNTSKVVNLRNYGDTTANGNYATYVDYGSYWVDLRYRTISFENDLEDYYLSLLNPINNNNLSGSNGYNGGNVGLDTVFNLLGNSMSALLGLFNISIIPGLTIGVLMFLPLVVTIIVLVFKAVKK